MQLGNNLSVFTGSLFAAGPVAKAKTNEAEKYTGTKKVVLENTDKKSETVFVEYKSSAIVKISSWSKNLNLRNEIDREYNPTTNNLRLELNRHASLEEPQYGVNTATDNPYLLKDFKTQLEKAVAENRKLGNKKSQLIENTLPNEITKIEIYLKKCGAE